MKTLKTLQGDVAGYLRESGHKSRRIDAARFVEVLLADLAPKNRDPFKRTAADYLEVQNERGEVISMTVVLSTSHALRNEMEEKIERLQETLRGTLMRASRRLPPPGPPNPAPKVGKVRKLRAVKKG